MSCPRLNFIFISWRYCIYCLKKGLMLILFFSFSLIKVSFESKVVPLKRLSSNTGLNERTCLHLDVRKGTPHITYFYIEIFILGVISVESPLKWPDRCTSLKYFLLDSFKPGWYSFNPPVELLTFKFVGYLVYRVSP